MVDNSVRKLAEYIGNLSYEQEQTKSNLSPNDANGFDQRAVISNAALECTLISTKLTYPTDAFYLSHPVQGKADGTYKLTGAYSGSTVLSTVTF